MPDQVLYQIPLAHEPIRWIIGAVCLVFVLAIFLSWLPRVIRWLLRVPAQGTARASLVIAGVILPVAIGAVPLLILIALIKNPMTYVSESGVAKESLLVGPTVSFSWDEIVHATCRSGRGGGLRSITLTSRDSRTIGMGNTGGVDFAALRGFLTDRLGATAMSGCMIPAERLRSP